MGERKVLNKYIPADFDPQLVPRSKKPKDDLIPVRMMLPFTIQCSTCSTFLYRGRKFNSKKEPVKGIDGKYLGIQRFRFYIKCSDCSRPITFLTDPKNADYEMETGGTRTYEVWHDESKTNKEFEENLEEEEKMNAMKALENRVAESQREMAELDALEEIRAMNKVHVALMKGGGKRAVGGGEMDMAKAVLSARDHALGAGEVEEEELNENGLTKDEEDLVKSIKFGVSNNLTYGGDGIDDDGNQSQNGSGSGPVIRRLDEEDELLAEKRRKEEAAALISKKQQKMDESKKNSMPLFKVKRKKRKDPTPAPNSSSNGSSEDAIKKAKSNEAKPVPAIEAKPEPERDESNSGGGALGGLLDYGSDSD